MRLGAYSATQWHSRHTQPAQARNFLRRIASRGGRNHRFGRRRARDACIQKSTHPCLERHSEAGNAVLRDVVLCDAAIQWNVTIVRLDDRAIVPSNRPEVLELRPLDAAHPGPALPENTGCDMLPPGCPSKNMIWPSSRIS